MDFKAEKSVLKVDFNQEIQLRISLNDSVFNVIFRKYEKGNAKMFLWTVFFFFLLQCAYLKTAVYVENSFANFPGIRDEKKNEWTAGLGLLKLIL